MYSTSVKTSKQNDAGATIFSRKQLYLHCTYIDAWLLHCSYIDAWLKLLRKSPFILTSF